MALKQLYTEQRTFWPPQNPTRNFVEDKDHVFVGVANKKGISSATVPRYTNTFESSTVYEMLDEVATFLSEFLEDINENEEET